MVPRNTTRPSLRLRIGPACEAGLSSGIRATPKKEKGGGGERLLTEISTSHRYLTLHISETVRDIDSYNEILTGMSY